MTDQDHLLAERDAQVREAFDAGWFAALDNTRSVMPKAGFLTRDEAFAAFQATHQRASTPEAGK